MFRLDKAIIRLIQELPTTHNLLRFFGLIYSMYFSTRNGMEKVNKFQVGHPVVFYVTKITIDKPSLQLSININHHNYSNMPRFRVLSGLQVVSTK
jgi:hypothetical protein